MADSSFLAFVLDQLTGLDGVRYRQMFGGVGLYAGDVFFAIVADGRLYFATNDLSRADYADRGMKAFRPKPDQILKRYYEVPVDVLEDDATLRAWAGVAVAAQRERPRVSRKRKPDHMEDN